MEILPYVHVQKLIFAKKNFKRKGYSAMFSFLKAKDEMVLK